MVFKVPAIPGYLRNWWMTDQKYCQSTESSKRLGINHCYDSTDKNIDNHFDLQTTITVESGGPWATASKCDLSSSST